MVTRRLKWDSKAFKALVKAFSPMPPPIRENALQKVINEIEKYVESEGRDMVYAEDVLKVSKVILEHKAKYMYESLIEALRSEGFKV